MSRRVLISVMVVLAGIVIASITDTRRAGANSFIVTNLNDSGTGSLRKAITDANSSAGADQISFDFGVAGTLTLTTGALPDIAEELTINGPPSKVVTVSGNDASRIFRINNGIKLTVTNLIIINGVGDGAGGAFHNSFGTLELTNCTITDCLGSIGGAIYSAGDLMINNCTISGNEAGTFGGGILINFGPTVTINNSTISGNRAGISGTGSGGAIYSDANQVTNTLTINNCTISDNSAQDGGGAITNSANSGTAILTINNSTITGNTAGSSSGGIDNSAVSFNSNNARATLTVNNSTIVGNTLTDSDADGGGGISNRAGPSRSTATATIGSSIIALNTSSTGPDLFGTFVSNGFNLIGKNNDSTGFTDGMNNDQVGSSASPKAPGLEMDPANPTKPLLENNGGPTKTIALVSGSTAFDKGKNFTPFMPDQRGAGFPRTYDLPLYLNAGAGDATDIGAFETLDVIPSITTVPTTRKIDGGSLNSQIATVKDDEDAEQNLVVKVNGSSSATVTGVSVTNISVGPLGDVTADVQAACGASDATFTPSVTDSVQQTTTAMLMVTVTPSNPPFFTSCPGDLTKSTDPGKCEAKVIYNPTASDNCDGAITPVCEPPSGAFFPKGITTVTCTATDSEGEISNPCSFKVTVSDSEAPVAACKNKTVQLNAAGTASITTNDVFDAVNSSDNCGTVNAQSVTPNTFNCSNKGANTVTLTVNDGNGNTATCQATVTVVDSINPVAKCKNATVFLNGNGAATITAADVDNGSTDNCGIASRSLSKTTFDCTNKGANTVTLTVTDTSGNTNSCQATGTVVDNIAPTVACSPNIIRITGRPGTLSTAVNYAAPVASDNCPGVGVVCSPPTGSIFTVGTTTVTCTATDSSNNTKQCSFNVTVYDVCLQDTNSAAKSIVINSQTGDYIFCCGATKVTGRGLITKQGSVITLQHNSTAGRITARVDGTARSGSASLQGTTSCVITDTNITDNTCPCVTSP